MKVPGIPLLLCIFFYSALPIVKSQNMPEVSDRLISLFELKIKNAGIIADISDPSSLSEIIKWSKKSGLLAHCTYWLEYQEAKFPDFLPLRMALADCFFSSGGWEKLKASVSMDTWEYQDHLRLNYLAFAQRELADGAWPQTWNAALNAAKENQEKTKSLILFLAQWKKWDTELDPARKGYLRTSRSRQNKKRCKCVV